MFWWAKWSTGKKRANSGLVLADVTEVFKAVRLQHASELLSTLHIARRKSSVHRAGLVAKLQLPSQSDTSIFQRSACRTTRMFTINMHYIFWLTEMNLRLLAYQLASVIDLLIPFSQRAGASTTGGTSCRTAVLIACFPLPNIRTVSCARFRGW
jgi:hypothetical protein